MNPILPGSLSVGRLTRVAWDSQSDRSQAKVHLYYNAEFPPFLELRHKMSKRSLEDEFVKRYELKLALHTIFTLNYDFVDEEEFTEDQKKQVRNLLCATAESLALATKSELEIESKLKSEDSAPLETPAAEGALRHISAFALAPQPLLVLLGSLLGDIVPCDVYQRHREPSTWSWPSEREVPPFESHRPDQIVGPAALVFGVSGSVSDGRVHGVLGQNASIWRIGVASPHNDVVKSRRQTAAFRSLVRTTLEQIKAAHGHGETLHLFPAMPVSLAVELGRVRRPKADMPWIVYDQVNSQGGFVRALSIPEGERE
jgi:hypothetical protein